jgi:hypothetical protein
MNRKLTAEDMQFIWEIASRIRRTAHRADLLDLPSSSDHPRFLRDHHGYDERYSSSYRRIESPQGYRRDSENNVYPFLRRGFSYRQSTSPQRRFPSNRDRRLSLSPQRVPVYSQRRNQNPSPSASRRHPQSTERQLSPYQQNKSKVEDEIVNPNPIVARDGGPRHISPLRRGISDVPQEKDDGAKEHNTTKSRTHQPKSANTQPQTKETQHSLEEKEVPKEIINATSKSNVSKAENQKIVDGKVSVEAISKSNSETDPKLGADDVDWNSFSFSKDNETANITTNIPVNDSTRTTFRSSEEDKKEEGEGVIENSSPVQEPLPEPEKAPKDNNSREADSPESKVSDKEYEYEGPPITQSRSHIVIDFEIEDMMLSEEGAFCELAVSSTNSCKNAVPSVASITKPASTEQETLYEFSKEDRDFAEKPFYVCENYCDPK